MSSLYRPAKVAFSVTTSKISILEVGVTSFMEVCMGVYVSIDYFLSLDLESSLEWR